MIKRQSNKVVGMSLLLAVTCFRLNLFAQLPSIPVIHLVNDSNKDLYDTLSITNVFTSDFKGSNDVTITKLAGSLSTRYTDRFGGANSFGNPSYATNFLGATTNGTGDGMVGDILDIQTSAGLSLQFDFTLRFTPADRFLLIDCDSSEAYEVQAFVKSGTNFTAVSPTNWEVTNFPGSTQTLPDSNFPIWNANSGILTSPTSGNLVEPITVFTPNQAIDRVIITELSGGGTASLQFISPGLGTLKINRSGSTVLVTVPTNNVVVSLQTTTNLAQPNWTTLTNNAIAGTNMFPISTNRAQFFRLKY